MNANPAGSIAIQIHRARERLAASEARARRLAGLIDRMGGDGAQARAVADAFAIIEDLIAQQRRSIVALEATAPATEGAAAFLEPCLEELRSDAVTPVSSTKVSS